MEINVTEKEKYRKAKEKVKCLKDFYSHLVAYCLVISFLVFVNLKTSPGYYWFWFPMFGWGIGVGIHAFSVFGKDLILGEDWEDKKIKELMDKDKKQYWE